MGRSQETSNKKEVKNRRDKKRKEKEKKRLIRKEGGKSSYADMIAYVDEFGKISSTPPDPDKKIEVEAENIETSSRKKTTAEQASYVRKGVVTFFNDSKGFGFIRDMENKQSVFVHANNLQEPVRENNIVAFELGKGPKGSTALNVRLVKE
jgi:cold shock CspA family protein